MQNHIDEILMRNCYKIQVESRNIPIDQFFIFENDKNQKFSFIFLEYEKSKELGNDIFDEKRKAEGNLISNNIHSFK